ncbi:hypothetical protein DFH28DRAFT_911478 [Melampsora americana]|nr:hypothetical protein DFH28DRAFT_911478 [Melampsora americana]
MSPLGPPIYLNPIKPQLPLPLPVPRKETGQYCISGKCKHPRPHSTTYYQPKGKFRFPSIGIRCRFDPTYYRQYNVQEYKLEVIRHNTMANVDLTAIDPNIMPSQQSQSSAPPPPQHSQSRAKASRRPPKLRPEDQCMGRNGLTAHDGHAPRKNAGCAIDACSKVCHEQHLICNRTPLT